MSLSIAEVYTNSYSLVNANSYSTSSDTQSHNRKMDYKTWLSDRLGEIKATPTDLARAIDGEVLNQPTIQRILKGKTPNPRIKTVAMIEKALIKLGSPNPRYDQNNVIEGESRRVDEKNTPVLPSTVPIIKPATEREAWMAELVLLAEQLDTLHLALLIGKARDFLAEQPAKQTLESTG